MIYEKSLMGDEICFPESFQGYSYINTIGRGGFGVVVRARHLKTGIDYACKIVSRANLVLRGDLLNFEHELRIHETLRHHNIVALKEIVYEKDVIIVVMELVRNSLNKMIQEKVSMNYNWIIFQILQALRYLHAKGIGHCDLKPDNVLIDENMTVKLCDFGCSRYSRDKQDAITRTGACGTPFFMAPEVIQFKSLGDEKSDMWSFGVLVCAMLTDSLPWKDGSDEYVIEQILRGEYLLPSPMPADIRYIVKKCLVVDPERRATADELVNMELFKVERVMAGKVSSMLANKPKLIQPRHVMLHRESSMIASLRPIGIKPVPKSRSTERVTLKPRSVSANHSMFFWS